MTKNDQNQPKDSGKGGERPGEPRPNLPRFDDRPGENEQPGTDRQRASTAPQTGEPRYGDGEPDDPRRSSIEAQRQSDSASTQVNQPQSNPPMRPAQ